MTLLMGDSTRRYLIAYDIVNDRRRNRTAKKLQSFGIRVQYSVFLADLSPAKFRRLVDDLEDGIRAEEDSVLICDLGPADRISSKDFRYLGQSGPRPIDGPVVV